MAALSEHAAKAGIMTKFMLQRRFQRVAWRDWVADRIAARVGRGPVAGTPQAQAAAKALDADGFAMTPWLMTPERVDDMRRYFAKHPSFNPYKPEQGSFQAPEQAPKGTHVAHFRPDVVLNAPHALAIANDPAVLEAVQGALGCKPTISYMAAWWSIAGDEEGQHAELFHRDYDDWRFIKLFVYLTDVDAGAGPHIYVRGSHRENALMPIRRYSDAEVESAFGRERFVQFEGPAGNSFLENTFGVHRGLPARTASRLILQVVYCQGPIPYGPLRPVAEAGRVAQGLSLDPYINRIYLRA
jgi:hypothetical protein